MREWVAELDACPSACLFHRHTPGTKCLLAFAEMKGDLAIDVALERSRPERVDETSKPGHRQVSSLASDVTKDPTDAFSEARPAIFFDSQLSATLGGERVEARLAVLLGQAPFGFEPALLLHSVQSGVERALFDAQEIAGHPLHVRGDRVPVQPFARGQGLQDEQGQRALQDVVLRSRHALRSRPDVSRSWTWISQRAKRASVRMRSLPPP